jgi:two-component system sensor histidine kinase KdpD
VTDEVIRTAGARTRQWLLWFATLALLTLAMWTVRERLDKAHVALAFLLVVLGGSAANGRALGISLAGVAFFLFDWVFLPPYDTLVIANPLDWLVLFAFLVTGVVAAQLLERQRREAENARQRADEIDRLATLGAETLNAPRAEDALDAIASVISDAMKTDRCEIVRWDARDGIQSVGRSSATDMLEQDSKLFSYIVLHAEPAAERADHTLTVLGDALNRASDASSLRSPLSELLALGIPLSVRGRVVGALRLSSTQPFALSDDQRRVLSALSYYAALGVERVSLTSAAEEAESLRRADRLKDALLASVSHDLRTPLTTIKGIANEVWHGGDPLRAQTIEQEADRLNELVEDLLELSQINAGVLRVAIALNTTDDVVGTVLERIEGAHAMGRIEVRVTSEDEVLVGEFDFAHTVRALTNLLENALKYSPPGAPVLLDIRQVDGRLRFTVQDSGPGIDPGDDNKIFEPFYRGTNIPDGVRGTGLGLTIARQLIEAQRGSLTYEPVVNGGSRFSIDLPAAATLTSASEAT